MIRKIVEKIPDEQLQQDLEKYRQRSVELGATDAKVITTDEVVIDERVLAKCTYPRCFGYGTNANCPPYAMSPDQLRKVLNKFRYAIFIKLEVPADDIAGVEARDRKLLKPFIRKLSEITAKIEAEAFYDGYHLALAFGNGSCKGLFCADVECRALVPGQACPHHLRARAHGSSWHGCIHDGRQGRLGHLSYRKHHISVRGALWIKVGVSTCPLR